MNELYLSILCTLCIPVAVLASPRSVLASEAGAEGVADNVTHVEVEHYQLFHFDFTRIKTQFSIALWLLSLGIARICMLTEHTLITLRFPLQHIRIPHFLCIHTF